MVTSYVELAERLAREAHAGLFRRDGKTPYIYHVEDVVKRLYGHSGEIEAIAWLHDTVEDTDLTLHKIKEAGFPQPVVEGVAVLTRPHNVEYDQYIRDISWYPLARRVKIADMLSNLGDKPTDKQIRKYAAALLVLV